MPGRTRFLDGDPEVIERLIRINYLGGVWCLRAFLPGLRAAAPSDVVNIVSVSGVVAGPPSGPYSASKHAQLAFSRTVAAELRGERIRVHTVKPGFTETEGFPQSWLPPRVQRVVIGPEDVAAHVLRSLDEGRGETTVPWYYGPSAPLQDADAERVHACPFAHAESSLESPHGRTSSADDPGRHRRRRVPVGAAALPAAEREDRAPVGAHARSATRC